MVQVLDESAFALCKANNIPVVVFNLHTEGNIIRAAQGCTASCTVVDEHPDCPEDCMPPAPTTTTPAGPEILSLLNRTPAESKTV
jgi:hypothetical protein